MTRFQALMTGTLFSVLTASAAHAVDLPYRDADVWSKKKAGELITLCKKEVPIYLNRLIAEQKNSALYQATELNVENVYDVMQDVGPLIWMISTDYTFKDTKGKKREFVVSCLFDRDGTSAIDTASNER